MKRWIYSKSTEGYSEVTYDNASKIHASIESESLLNEVQNWARNWRTSRFRKFEKSNLYLEHHSIQSLINNYIKYFNQNVSDYGDGFATDWDPDDTMDILYKNGTLRTVSPDWDDGTKKIKVDGIDSIILNGGWGTAFAGPSIMFEDYTVYDDIPDIRVEFAD